MSDTRPDSGTVAELSQAASADVIKDLVERSSLGSSGARSLRRHTPRLEPRSSGRSPPPQLPSTRRNRIRLGQQEAVLGSADDVAQEVCLAVVNTLPGCTLRGLSFRAWSATRCRLGLGARAATAGASGTNPRRPGRPSCGSVRMGVVDRLSGGWPARSLLIARATTPRTVHRRSMVRPRDLTITYAYGAEIADTCPYLCQRTRYGVAGSRIASRGRRKPSAS